MENAFETDILGEAMWDYYQGEPKGPLMTHSSLDQDEEMPLPHLFRSYDQMPALEQRALQECRGRVLDIGSGSGIHSLYLQNEKDLDVTALDQSIGAIRCCKAQGIKDAHCTTLAYYRQHSQVQYDTLLLLMNGIGLAGQLHYLPAFLESLKGLMRPKGQILLDSSDIRYVFEEEEDGGIWVPGDRLYYGDVQYHFSYDGREGPDFDWVFVDPDRLKKTAEDVGFEFELLEEGPHYDYLARLILA